jgi:hypothetical protein
MKRKLLTETLVCPREHLVIISYTTGLSFAEKRIGPLAAIITNFFYLLALYLFVLPNTPENPFASIYSETLMKTTSQLLLLLVGFDTYLSKVLRYTPYTCGSSLPSKLWLSNVNKGQIGTSNEREPIRRVKSCCTCPSMPLKIEEPYISPLTFDIFRTYIMRIHMLYAMLEFRR